MNNLLYYPYINLPNTDWLYELCFTMTILVLYSTDSNISMNRLEQYGILCGECSKMN